MSEPVVASEAKSDTGRAWQLRPYQMEALDAVGQGWEEYQRQLVVMPTGSGKTILFARAADDEAVAERRTLIVAHRDELLQQAQAKLLSSCGLNTVLEKADSRALDYFQGSLFSHAAANPKVVVGSVQTMQGKRLAQWPRDMFDLVIIDEAHHVLADGYRRVIDHFHEARLLGVTATPDRGDKRNLGSIFQNIAYEYPLLRAIQDKFLAPIRAQLLPVSIDLSAVRTSHGDYQAADLDDTIAPYLAQVARQVAEHRDGRKTLVFLPLVRTSQMFAELLCAEGVHARHVDGDSSDRKEILAAFERSDFECLCNSSLLLEGYDCPDIACVVCLRPTKSRGLYCQMIGRGTRIAPGKQDLLILDFLWQTTEHNLCVPASLIAKDEKEAQQIMGLVTCGGESIDIVEAQSEAKRQREESLRKALEAQSRKQKKVIDPIAFALALRDDVLEEYEPVMPWEYDKPSAKQLEVLTKFWFDAEKIACKGMASALLDRLFRRRELNLCSPKQASILARFGYDAATIGFQEASSLIDRIAANGWRRPAEEV
jgi:superfamily II DNA or RNA helicase